MSLKSFVLYDECQSDGENMCDGVESEGAVAPLTSDQRGSKRAGEIERGAGEVTCSEERKERKKGKTR